MGEKIPDEIKKQAEKDYMNGMKYKDLAVKYSVTLNTIKKWKQRYKWNRKDVHKKSKKVYKNKGVPNGNKNAEKHGLFSKYLPDDTQEIMDVVDKESPLDILWDMIKIKYAAIIRAQKIMYVKDHDDLTKEIKKTKTQMDTFGPKDKQKLFVSYREEEYDLQYAWNKEATFLNAQSRAMGELRSLIKQYDEQLKDNLATEEQKARIEKLKSSVNIANKDIEDRKKLAEEKLQLDKDRFKHQKEIDSLKEF